ncbi:hypothetical protein DH2020_024385 [Rehmannia glutinosa]|uniref:RING-type E3 ubiquitin transferase n=1 Tax=Rehmannia glutinosa TaxID=99300 RepID=A0ABR0W530_REHGL
MAKSGVFEGDPPTTAAAKAVELKKELQKLVKSIVDEDDVNLDAIERAQQMLFALKELKLKRTVSLKLRNNHHNQEMVSETVPEEFKCPLSKELMRDPVIIATGQTYDRPFIQKWLKAGNRTCPQTQQYINDEGLTGRSRPFPLVARENVFHIVEQKEAAKELRLLTKQTPVPFAFGESRDFIPQLLSPLSQSKCESGEVHSDLQEDIITTLLNLSIHDNNKKLVVETPMVISFLWTLRKGTIQTRSNAAAAFFTLSALDSNKALIGKSGALKPLIDLLTKGIL